MKPLLTACIALLAAASGASAHPGHLIEVAGHGHWLGAAAIGAAIALGAWTALKGKKEEQAEADEPELDEEELQEA